MDGLEGIDLNSQLVGRGLDTDHPQDTYVDFANNIVKNQQSQAAQEAAIARAQELAKQSKLDTAGQQEAADAGFNKDLIGTLTPEAAVAYVKAALAAKKITGADAAIDAWGAQLKAEGRPVPKSEVEDFLSRTAKPSTHANVATPITADQDLKIPNGKSAVDIGLENMTDANGKSVDDKTISDGTFYGHVPTDGMYSVEVSNDGQVEQYVPAGKVPVDPQAKADAKSAADAEHAWQKLNAAEDTFIKSARGNSVTQSIGRAARALNELTTNETLTPQVLSYVQKDISGIFQGGVPPVTGMEAEDFTTTLQKINGLIAKYTGIQGYLQTDKLGDQREYLLGLVSRLVESTTNILKSMIVSEAAAYEPIIHADPPRWQKMVDDKMATATAGLSANSQAAMKQRQMPATATPIPGVATPAAADPLAAKKAALRAKLGL